jgi:hypothetical protein
MKKVSFLLLLNLLIALVGCETEPILFNGPYHVRFTDAAETQRESFSKTIQIEVHLAAPTREQDLTVRYSITGSARENTDYKILGTKGSLIIPEGEYFGYIELQLINNSNNILRSQDVKFTITSVSDSELAVGQGEGSIGKSFTYTIVDDCVLGGFYYGTRSAFTIPVRDITITSQDCENYILSNWNIDILSEPIPASLQFIDNFDNTLTIPRQDLGGIVILGSGTVNVMTRFINFNLTLIDEETSREFEFSLNLFPD